MGLAAGIAGLPNVGKTTLLNALTRAGAEVSNYPFCTIEQNVGIAAVPDPDLWRLHAILTPAETIPTTIRFIDIAGLVEGASKGDGLGNKFLGHVRETDAILHVVRCFEAPDVMHTTGAPDPVRDVGIVETEFLLADLDLAERGLQRWRSVAKSGREGKEEAAVFERAVQALSAGTTMTAVALSEREREFLAASRFLTAKSCLYVANTDENDPQGRGELVRALVEAKGAQKVLPVSIRIEAEVAELPPDEQRAFLQGLELEKTALDLVIAACYRMLGLVTFSSIANDKLQAWELPRGGTAVQAAGRIHSDMERGFIRAEVMALQDLLAWGSRQALHDRGLLHVVGRDHVVADKDVLQIHFKA